MRNDRWLIHIFMLPAYVLAIFQGIREHVCHATRRRIGDPTKRSNCCGPMCNNFPLGQQVEVISELAAKLEHVSTINTGNTRLFACSICGQEWREDAESVGNFSEYPHVKKAT